MKFISNNLITTGLVVILITNMSNAFSLFFQIYLGRILSLNDYGLVTSFYALFGLLSIPIIIIPFIVTNFFLIEEKKKYINNYLSGLFILTFTLILVELIILIIFKKFLFNLLKFDNVNYLYLLLLIQFFAFFLAILIGVLISKGKYKTYSILGTLPLYFRFIILAIVFNLFFNEIDVTDVFVINFVALALSVGITLFFSETNMSVFFHLNNLFNNIKEILVYLTPLLLVFLMMLFLQNIDAILIRSIVDESESGRISSAIVLGKIPFYIISALIYMIFPEVLKNPASFISKVTIRNIIYLYLFTILFSLIGSMFIYLFSDYLINLLFGEKFNNLKFQFMIVANYYLQLAIFLILTTVSLALKRFKIYIFLSILVSIFVFYIYKSVNQAFIIFLVLNILVFISNFILVINFYANRYK